ncbi:MAG: M48 family metalloprotease [Halioglobus sp.]
MNFSAIINKTIKATHPIMLGAALFVTAFGYADELKLPNLGGASTSLFSAEYEHQLGRAWLRAFRSQAPTIDDPLLQDYLETLIYRLANHSQLEDRRIEVVVVDNATINAFAVPGGIIGIHNGLLQYAQSEDELATVLAHEIAHLSQRHFSRGVEYRQTMQPLTYAAMLASLVLMATVGGDVGMAALSATQAASQNSAMSYSRSNESEADRVGMQTMVDADMDPHAAPAMFERMLKASRYSSADRIPEFLRSHPLSENRIADTRNRAREHPKQMRHQNLGFQLMRARVGNQLAKTPAEAIQKFKGELDGSPVSREAAIYGLVLALTDAGRTSEASLELDSIWSLKSDRLEYIIADADIDMARNRPDNAVKNLARHLQLYPGNHALTMTYARALTENQQAHVAEEVLVAQSKRNPGDPALWYQLAEVQGLSGNIVGLHQSRAEYFISTGIFDQAEKQLNYALELVPEDYVTTARINQRLRDINRLRYQMGF